MKFISMLVSYLTVGFIIVSSAFSESIANKYSHPILRSINTFDKDKEIHIWIYFHDKGISSEDDIQNTLIHLQDDMNPKTKLRRAKTRGEILVDERDLPVHTDYIDQVLKIGGVLRTRSKWLNAISISIPLELVQNINKLHFVKSIDMVLGGKRIEPEVEAMSVDKTSHRTEYGTSYQQLEQINVIEAHDSGYTGQGVIVLMLDTGYYTDHESIHENQIIDEWDFINNDGETQNEEGDSENQHNHGTYTLSVLGGSFEGQLYGPAYNAEFLLAKTEDISQEVPIEEDWYVAGLEWGESLGADIASSSLGYIDWYEYDDLDGMTAVTTVVVNTAIENGMIITTAAGNSGENGIIAPADAFEVITCGAVDSSGAIGSFSSHGPTADGRTKPEVCAQGVYTYCANVDGPESYRHASGTSLSTPLIGGACAIILSAQPSWTPYQVRGALMESASQNNEPDNQYGWGIIDVMAAINVSFLLGDANSDHLLNILDAVLISTFILEIQTPTSFQFNRVDMDINGVVEVNDLVILIDFILASSD